MRTALELFRLFWHPIHFGMICLSLVFFFLPFNLAGQILFHDTEEKVGKEQMLAMFHEAKIITDSLKCIRDDAYSMDILYAGNELIMFLRGYFNVYHWKNNTWRQRNEPRKGGYDFGSKKFIWNNRNFSFGGYGYWSRHGDLIEFDLEKGIWQKVPLKGILPHGIMFTTKNGIRVLSDQCYDVNLQTLSVEKSPLNLPDKAALEDVVYGVKLESARWSFLNHGSSIFVLQKEHEKIYYSNVRTAESFKGFLFSHDDFVQCIRDSVIQWSPNGTIQKGFNIQEHVKHYMKFDLHPKKESGFDIVIYATLVFGLSISFYFWKKLKKKRRYITETWQNPFIPAFMSASGKQVTTEQLDKMLDIEDVTPLENRKYKRSRLLNEINNEYQIKYGKVLVNRLKDPDDGRKFIYEIDIS